MKSYGIELEYFVAKGEELQVLTEDAFVQAIGKRLSTDDFPLLGELRSATHPRFFLAASEILWQVKETTSLLSSKGFDVWTCPNVKLPLKTYRRLQRVSITKGGAREENLYNLTRPRKANTVQAGLHIHFSKSHMVGEKCDIKVFEQLDIPSIVRQFDNKFGQLIKDCHRQKGWYELKPWGFEYRSLPNNLLIEAPDILSNFVENELKW